MNYPKTNFMVINKYPHRLLIQALPSLQIALLYSPGNPLYAILYLSLKQDNTKYGIIVWATTNKISLGVVKAKLNKNF